jgi:serine phosphatase RsbU (regulator of sigma subunit)
METGERVSMLGTPHGEAMRVQAPQVVPGDEGVWLLAPVTNRGEAIGLLELRLTQAPAESEIRAVSRFAHALAYIVIANRRYTDLYDWGQRSIPLTLAAEIQHRLLPGSYTCEGGQFTLAGWLEPAGHVGGDTFDFSLERDALHLSLTDAMGHHVNAALLATLLVGATRNARRAGATLVEQAELGDQAIRDFAGNSQFVTGQLVRIDLVSARAEIVNAGHPAPLRLRGGVVEEARLEPDLPFGLATEPYAVQQLSLEPGDRLLFLTDGVLERRAAKVDVRAMLAQSAGQHPREAVRLLIQAAVDASGGRLEDDATALCLDWHGGPPRDRISAAGADTGA